VRQAVLRWVLAGVLRGQSRRGAVPDIVKKKAIYFFCGMVALFFAGTFAWWSIGGVLVAAVGERGNGMGWR